MIKRKGIVLTAGLAAVLGFQSTLVLGSTIEEEPLFKFGGSDPILLHGEQITVPKSFENKKEDFRATWVSTVSNIDFPKVNSEEEFKREFEEVVKNSKELGLNAIIFQVRPMLDAWYESSINPSSEFIDGTQGGKLSFDPLKIAIDIAHREGLELHAWFNPYRVTNNTRDYRKKEEKLEALDDMNFAKKNPDLVYEFANKLFLDPGRPEVVNHIVDSINEVINNYDVDAIHFDDYFYPYKTAFKKVLGYDESGEPIVDVNNTTLAMRDSDVDFDSFNNYSRGFEDIHAWREDNINLLVSSIKDTVKNYNELNGESVQFGISPFGIWGHESEIEGGSHTPTTSTASINDYVNTRKWVKDEMVDYLMPQIYWQFNQPAAPYGELVDWWNEQFKGVENSHLYIGHPNYKIIENVATDFDNPDEIPSQLRFNQKYTNVKGSSFFSYNKLKEKSTREYLYVDEDMISRYDEGISDIANFGSIDRTVVNNETVKTIKNYYNTLTKTPAKPWLDQNNTVPVNGLNGKNNKSIISLRWNDKNEDTRFYQIYRVEGNVKSIDASNPNNIIARFGKEQGREFIDETADKNKTYTYGVSIIDKAGNETDIKTFTVIKKN